MRAAISACSVSGTRSADPFPDPLSMSIRIVSSTNSGLPSVRSSASCGSAAGRSPVVPASWLRSCSTSSALSSSDSGSSSIAVDRDASSTPPRPRIEQLGPGEAQDENGRAHPVRDVLDEIEQRLFGPVDVLEEKDERLNLGDSLHHLARRPGDLLRASLPLERLHQPGGETEDVRNRLFGAALAELLERLLERVVVGDPGRRLHHLAEGPVRDALAVWKRAADEDARPLDAVEELSREAALPDAGLAVDREQVRATVAKAPVERVLEELELGLATDERGARAERTSGAVEHVDDPPGAQRAVDALQLERACILDDEAPSCETVGGGTDEDLSGPCRLLEPRCGDRLARRKRRVGTVDDDLPASIPIRASSSSSSTAARIARAARVARCASSSWACGTPNASHDRISGELLHDAPVLDDARRNHLEERVDTTPHDLGVGCLHQTSGIDDVDEQDRRELAFHD